MNLIPFSNYSDRLNQYIELDDNEYHSIDCVSAHGLMKCLKSYNHYLESRRSTEKTKAMNFGTAAHLMVLQPEQFHSRIAVAPNVDRRTKDGKAQYEAFLNESKGKTVIDSDEMETLLQMSLKLEELKTIPALAHLLKGEHVEKALLTHLAGDIPFRMKPDLVGEDFILDYKTTDDAWVWGFGRTARAYHYDFQLGLYRTVDAAVTGKAKRMLILAQEKTAPFEFQVYEIDPGHLHDINNVIQVAVSKYEQGLAGFRTGYPREILSLDVSRGGF